MASAQERCERQQTATREEELERLRLIRKQWMHVQVLKSDVRERIKQKQKKKLSKLGWERFLIQSSSSTESGGDAIANAEERCERANQATIGEKMKGLGWKRFPSSEFKLTTMQWMPLQVLKRDAREQNKQQVKKKLNDQVGRDLKVQSSNSTECHGCNCKSSSTEGTKLNAESNYAESFQEGQERIQSEYLETKSQHAQKMTVEGGQEQPQGKRGGQVLGAVGEAIAEIAETTKVLVVGEDGTETESQEHRFSINMPSELAGVC
ncbi:putative seed biotin-containing protein SBP65-like isoform [Sesbania bispinosa]|nr:putative seed biotin-containing protein SBP65-like isoform [Sesbania bispinosa]